MRFKEPHTFQPHKLNFPREVDAKMTGEDEGGKEEKEKGV